jgi:hypothetical protein
MNKKIETNKYQRQLKKSASPAGAHGAGRHTTATTLPSCKADARKSSKMGSESVMKNHMNMALDEFV